MKTTLTIFGILFCLTLFGQNSIKGIIIDKETDQPIPYVNIGIVNKNNGTLSDNNGRFNLNITSELNKDTIRFSSIGYLTESIVLSNLKEISNENLKIELKPEVVELNEVVISDKKLKEKIIGNKTTSGIMRGGFKNAPLGHELGIKIKIKKSPTYIQKFNTNITSNTGKSMKFRLNFYSIKNGLPNEKIVFKNIIFEIDKKEGEFTLDLSDYNIVVEEDFYCTVELIENQKEGEEIFFSAGLFGNPLVTRKTSQGNWDKIGTIGIGFNLSTKY